MNSDQTRRPVPADPLLSPLRAGEATVLPRLQARLAGAAADRDLLDVGYRVIDSPVGPLLLAATPRGLVRVAFDQEDHDTVLRELAGSLGSRVLEAPRLLEDAARQLDEYLAGRRDQFGLPLDLALVRGAFRRLVVEHLPNIPYGTTASYAAVAAAVGRPGASRAVGSACSHNPLPLVLPCHRVVRTDGTIGHYLGGTAAKQHLLGLEAA
jgi:methylated-DNA-[protein]-cysteine S-methyltransferase